MNNAINIPFKQFLITYNFRYVIDDTQEGLDTKIVRIYPPQKEDYDHNNWFEFGIYDFSEDSFKMSIALQCLSQEILNSYISSFHVDEKTSIFHVYLTKDKERDYY